MFGDTLAVRQQLITGWVQGLLVPALIGLVALAFLLWIGVGRGLGPVRRIAEAIAARAPDDQSPLAVDRVPRELSPLTQEIDDLFARIERLCSGEKRFLASRSEEHTTALQSLMRVSYAVFFLKKAKHLIRTSTIVTLERIMTNTHNYPLSPHTTMI